MTGSSSQAYTVRRAHAADAVQLARFMNELADEGLDMISGRKYRVDQLRAEIEPIEHENGLMLIALGVSEIVGMLRLRKL
jgi:hypothetical protein